MPAMPSSAAPRLRAGAGVCGSHFARLLGGLLSSDGCVCVCVCVCAGGQEDEGWVSATFRMLSQAGKRRTTGVGENDIVPAAVGSAAAGNIDGRGEGGGNGCGSK